MNTEKLKSESESRDTGMAMVLILLIAAICTKDYTLLVPIAAVALFVTMAAPIAFRPITPIWLGFSKALGAVMSRVVMAVLYFGVITPMGLFRRFRGRDAMKRREWKKSTDSVFRSRDHMFEPKDIRNVY